MGGSPHNPRSVGEGANDARRGEVSGLHSARKFLGQWSGLLDRVRFRPRRLFADWAWVGAVIALGLYYTLPALASLGLYFTLPALP